MGIEPVPTITTRTVTEIPWRIYVCGVIHNIGEVRRHPFRKSPPEDTRFF
jgi:hypothetical protein